MIDKVQIVPLFVMDMMCIVYLYYDGHDGVDDGHRGRNDGRGDGGRRLGKPRHGL